MVFQVSATPPGLQTRWLRTFGALVARGFRIHSVVSIVFVSRHEMQRLNMLYRGKDKPTDVLSFNVTEDRPRGAAGRRAWPIIDHGDKTASREQPIFGEIMLCAPILKAQAHQKKHSRLREFQILTIHGVLHLLGYDHERDTDARVMEGLEKKLLGRTLKNVGKRA